MSAKNASAVKPTGKILEFNTDLWDKYYKIQVKYL